MIIKTKEFFWEKEYELFEIGPNGDLRLFKEWGIE